MSFDAFLNQTCTISRRKQTGKNRYNNAANQLFVVATGVRCRKTQKTVRVINPETSEQAFVKADLVLFPPGTNVQEMDQIAIGAQVWTAKQVLGRQGASVMHHLSVIVEALNAQAQP